MEIEFRPATEDDREWLFALDVTTMRPPPGAGGAADVAARRAGFDRYFAPGAMRVVRVAGEDCGVLRLEERGAALYVAVLEVAPAWQGRGVGSAVLRRVLAEAGAARRPVALRVHTGNAAARRLYERLGFRVAAEAGGKLEMRWDGAPDPAG